MTGGARAACGCNEGMMVRDGAMPKATRDAGIGGAGKLRVGRLGGGGQIAAVLPWWRMRGLPGAGRMARGVSAAGGHGSAVVLRSAFCWAGCMGRLPACQSRRICSRRPKIRARIVAIRVCRAADSIPRPPVGPGARRRAIWSPREDD